MSKAKYSRKLLAAALAAGMAGSVGAALAQDTAAKWTQLHEAVRLAEICREVSHDRETWRSLGTKIDRQRIVYRAAPGDKVEIKGSEVVKGWTKARGDVWQVTLPSSFFGDFNPYSDLIRGDWFDPRKREHYTGAVYLNGMWLAEAAALDDVMDPVGETPLWFGKVEGGNTTLWAQFRGVNPNEQLVEITYGAPSSIPTSRGATSSPCAASRCATPRSVGAAHGRADRADWHALEQGLDHREQHSQPLRLFRHQPGQTRRRV